MRPTHLSLLLLPLVLTACSSGPGPAKAAATHTPEAVVTSPAAVMTLSPSAPSSAASRAARTVTPTPSRPPRVRSTPRASQSTPPAPTAAGRYTFPLRCSASYGHSHHDYPATDMFAARGCRFVAPIGGRVDEVTYVDHWSSSSNRGADRGGLSVSIVGSDGVRYYGSHLERVAAGIKPGVSVGRGAVLGYVGNTGSARGTATHLHFGVSWPTRAGIWWVRRGEVYPWPYLDSWRAGGQRSPAAAVAAKRRQVGTEPPCPSYC